MAQRGRLMLVKVSSGTSPDTFSSVGTFRSKSMRINNETIDVTTDANAPWRQLLGDSGLRSVSISGSGIFEDNAATNRIEDLAMSGALEDFQVTFENGDYFQGAFQVTSVEYTGDTTQAQTFNLSMESAGTVYLLRA